MNKDTQNQYQPDYVSPPGETLQETIDTIGMSQAELAERTGRPKKTINEIIKGKGPITPETALQFERVLGTPARFWNSRERNYREDLAGKKELERLQEDINWLAKFPIREMVGVGWISLHDDPVEQVRELLNYLGVASRQQWKSIWLSPSAAPNYRKSPAFKSTPEAVSAWLRQGELVARDIQCSPYNARAFKTVLSEIRNLTITPPENSQLKMVRLCAGAGVAVAFVPEIPKIHLSGATRWLSPLKALIQLSLRHKSDDHLWFSFFHEAAHILLHGKRAAFIEDDTQSNDMEAEANRFASIILIPQKRYRQFVAEQVFSKKAILEFASDLGISPGIVVGRLQHDELIKFNHCNDLKKRFTFSKKET